MPQLLPFYWFNQFSFSFVLLGTLLYVLSKYVLPNFALLQVTRMYILKLSNKN